jgi:hypothetical protein
MSGSLTPIELQILDITDPTNVIKSLVALHKLGTALTLTKVQDN